MVDIIDKFEFLWNSLHRNSVKIQLKSETSLLQSWKMQNIFHIHSITIKVIFQIFKRNSFTLPQRLVALYTWKNCVTEYLYGIVLIMWYRLIAKISFSVLWLCPPSSHSDPGIHTYVRILLSNILLLSTMLKTFIQNCLLCSTLRIVYLHCKCKLVHRIFWYETNK